MLKEQLGQLSFHAGANMKWYAISWLLPSKRSASVFLSLGESNTYSFSTLTQGSWWRSAAIASRSHVSCFSLTSSFLRAASHSSRDTTFGLSTVRVDIFVA